MAAGAKSFEHGASAYEKLRPPFPDQLFDDLVAEAGPRFHGRVLEVGAGTGKATVPLARRGVRLHVVEPSADMLRVLSEQLDAADLQHLVSTYQHRFEDLVPGEGRRYDAVVAAQSFHWADPQTRWSRLAQLLEDDGVAFMFWSGWQLDPWHHDLAGIRRTYDRHGTGLTPDIEDHRSETAWAETEAGAESQLGAPSTATYLWEWSVPIADYLGLLATTSEYAVVEPSTRESLFGALTAELGPSVHLNGRTRLLTVRPATR